MIIYINRVILAPPRPSVGQVSFDPTRIPAHTFVATHVADGTSTLSSGVFFFLLLFLLARPRSYGTTSRSAHLAPPHATRN